MKALSVGLPGRLNRTIVEPDRLWAADLSEHPFEHSNDIGAAELLPHFHRWRQPSEGVDNSQNADLAAVEQLVMNKVHGPDLCERSPARDRRGAAP